MASARAASSIFILTFITVVGWTLANAQSLKLGLKGGLLYLVSTNSSSGEQDIYTKQEGGYGFGPWVPSVGMDFRYSPPQGRLTFAADASYSWLKGDGTIEWVEATGDSHGDYQSSLYVVSAGVQCDLLSGPARPYLGVRLLWTHMTNVKSGSWVPPIGGFDQFGAGLLGGATFDLSSSLALDVCARYNFTRITNPGGYNPYFNGFFIGSGLLFELL